MESKNRIGATRGAMNLKYFRTIPLEALAAAATALEYGGELYGYRNWEKGLPWQQMIDSTRRHLDDFERGMNTDVSGLNQVDMLMASCMMLVASVLRGIGEDDRTFLNEDDGAWTGKECANYITAQIQRVKDAPEVKG